MPIPIKSKSKGKRQAVSKAPGPETMDASFEHAFAVIDSAVTAALTTGHES
jgi:hypothetical protein